MFHGLGVSDCYVQHVKYLYSDFKVLKGTDLLDLIDERDEFDQYDIKYCPNIGTHGVGRNNVWDENW